MTSRQLSAAEISNLAEQFVKEWAAKHPGYKIKYPGKLRVYGIGTYDDNFNYVNFHTTKACKLYGKPSEKRVVEENTEEYEVFYKDEHQ